MRSFGREGGKVIGRAEMFRLSGVWEGGEGVGLRVGVLSGRESAGGV